MTLSARAVARIAEGTFPGGRILNNTGDGIRAILGSGVVLATPATVIDGNGGFGLFCNDLESSLAAAPGATSGIGPNTSGGSVALRLPEPPSIRTRW